jgi:hypothetical protein
MVVFGEGQIRRQALVPGAVVLRVVLRVLGQRYAQVGQLLPELGQVSIHGLCDQAALLGTVTRTPGGELQLREDGVPAAQPVDQGPLVRSIAGGTIERLVLGTDLLHQRKQRQPPL